MKKKLGTLILVAVLAAVGGAFLMTQTQEAQHARKEKAAMDNFKNDMDDLAKRNQPTQ